jgi:hypothetical protein
MKMTEVYIHEFFTTTASMQNTFSAVLKSTESGDGCV